MLSRDRNVDLEATGFEFGAVDFITKPLSPSVLLNRVAHQIKIDELLKKRTARLERLQNGILDVVVDMVESRDKINYGHVDRTSKFVRVLIECMIENNVYADEMKGWDVDIVISSSRLHDVGKIAVSDAILNKPGRLTEEEFAEMKTHAEEGEQIIEIIIKKTGDEPYLQHAKLFAGYHHEKWDGSGYPRGLQYEDIPLQGRIMAIADVYDALVTPRPYKLPMSHEEALFTIREDAGRHFDPAIIDVFCEVADKFNAIAMM
ncbi:MAG: HD domain-containing protein [Defluviitaleaceae bacterium]|nr:HD domain-containing protein [Defluviitaleaceae bacterium]MCL2275794.1 HD domain-containing protein [Defluviitaleaceae bacterium]